MNLNASSSLQFLPVFVLTAISRFTIAIDRLILSFVPNGMNSISRCSLFSFVASGSVFVAICCLLVSDFQVVLAVLQDDDEIVVMIDHRSFCVSANLLCVLAHDSDQIDFRFDLFL